MFLGLFHIGVYTTDIDASLSFYTNALHFTPEWRGVVNHPTGLVEAAVLKQGSCTIELVKPVDLSRVHSQAGPVQHIALEVASLSGAMEHFAALGIPLSAEGVEELPDFAGGIRHCFIAGPSGERIELCERLDR